MKLLQVMSHAACLRAALILKTGSGGRLAGKSSVAAANLFQSVHRMLVDASLLNPSNEDCRVQLCLLQYDSGGRAACPSTLSNVTLSECGTLLELVHARAVVRL